MNFPDTKKVQSYLELAHSDHLAGRHLLRYGFLEQGCVLASTAVEKYLKSIIGVHGMVRTEHIDKKLLALVRQVQPELLKGLDEDFLIFLGKCFRLRYASVTSPGFSIVINQYKTLMALDRTVANIDSGFKIVINGADQPTPYRRDLAESRTELIEDNVALSPSIISDIISRNNKVYELKIEKGLNFIMATYQTNGVNFDGTFLKKTEIGTSRSSFQLTRG